VCFRNPVKSCYDKTAGLQIRKAYGLDLSGSNLVEIVCDKTG